MRILFYTALLFLISCKVNQSSSKNLLGTKWQLLRIIESNNNRLNSNDKNAIAYVNSGTVKYFVEFLNDSTVIAENNRDTGRYRISGNTLLTVDRTGRIDTALIRSITADSLHLYNIKGADVDYKRVRNNK